MIQYNPNPEKISRFEQKKSLHKKTLLIINYLHKVILILQSFPQQYKGC